MLNYTSRPHDVLTMAHELGHGVHASLARPQGIFQFTTPLTLAETASIFGETIVLERLLERAPDAAGRLDLLAGSLDGAVAAVFRQVAMNRFENAVHTERRERGEMSTDRFGELWLETQSDLLGDSVDLSERLRASGGPTCRTSWTRPGTCTRTPTATCSRCRSTAATRRPARISSRPTSTS